MINKYKEEKNSYGCLFIWWNQFKPFVTPKFSGKNKANKFRFQLMMPSYHGKFIQAYFLQQQNISFIDKS